MSLSFLRDLKSKLTTFADKYIPTVTVVVFTQGNEFVAVLLVSDDLSHKSFTVSKVLVTRRLIRSSVDAAWISFNA